MKGVIVCKDENEYRNVIAFLKEHHILGMATTDQDECDHWMHEFYPSIVYEEGDAYGSVFLG